MLLTIDSELVEFAFDISLDAAFGNRQLLAGVVTEHRAEDDEKARCAIVFILIILNFSYRGRVRTKTTLNVLFDTIPLWHVIDVFPCERHGDKSVVESGIGDGAPLNIDVWLEIGPRDTRRMNMVI